MGCFTAGCPCPVLELPTDFGLDGYTVLCDDGIADSGQLVCGELGQFGVSAAVPV